jgi:hypothetical protein
MASGGGSGGRLTVVIGQGQGRVELTRDEPLQRRSNLGLEGRVRERLDWSN